MPLRQLAPALRITVALVALFALWAPPAAAEEQAIVWGDAARIELAEVEGMTEWAGAFTTVPPVVILRPAPTQLWVVFSAAATDLRSSSEEVEKRWRVAFATAQGVVTAERVGGSAGVDGDHVIDSTVYAPPAAVAVAQVQAVLLQAPADSPAVRRFTVAQAEWAARQARIGSLMDAAPLPAAELGRAFAFELDSLDHGRLRSADFRGRPLLIEFWASWCGPCAASARDLAALQARVDRDRLAVIGISIDQDPAAVRAFIRRHGGDWPQHVVGDEERGQALLHKVFGQGAVPRYLLLDADGVVRHIGIGPVPAQGFERRLREIGSRWNDSSSR